MRKIQISQKLKFPIIKLSYIVTDNGLFLFKNKNSGEFQYFKAYFVKSEFIMNIPKILR